MGFDCASRREIIEVLPFTSPANIVYAQPCKKEEDIHYAKAQGVQTTVVDSVEEVEKLAECDWKGRVLVRLLVSDAGSKQPFSKKFGAPHEWLGQIYDIGKTNKLHFAGFSFHVGSECEAPRQYADAIADCKSAEKIAKQYGYETEMIDIGGGFLPNADNFQKIANEVKYARQKYFNTNAISWIAEPGRFLAAPTHTLYTTVIGKKPVWPPPKTAVDPAWRITIDDSVYGSFSNIPFDQQKPVLERVRVPNSKKEKRRPTVVFGRTCDSGDCLGTDLPLHEVEVGDVLRVENMGAYTTVTASEFNGFPKPQKIYEE